MSEAFLPMTLPLSDFGQRQSREQEKLLPALMRAKAAFQPIRRGAVGVSIDDQTGAPQGTYRYADLTAHLTAVEPALVAEGLLLEQDVLIVGQRTGLMVTRLTHVESGQWRCGALPFALPVDPDPQVAGSRLTYMRRYGLALFLGLAPQDEEDDGGIARAAQASKPKVVKPRARAVAPEPAGAADAAPEAEKAEPRPHEMVQKLRLEMREAEKAEEALRKRAAWLQVMSDVHIGSVFDSYVALVGDAPPAIEGVTWPEVPDAA
jgi:hypothetical protein